MINNNENKTDQTPTTASSTSSSTTTNTTTKKKEVQVEIEDVIRLMLQFCKENHMTRSFEAIQSETKVSLNTVDSMKQLVNDVIHGRWDSVLQQLQYVQLPRYKWIDLYEHIIFELCEMRETDAAKYLFTIMSDDNGGGAASSSISSSMISSSSSSTAAQNRPCCFDEQFRMQEPERYAKLYRIIYQSRQQVAFDPLDAYGSRSSREQRRYALANALREEVRVAPPARLLTLIGQALKHQQEHYYDASSSSSSANASASLKTSDLGKFDLFSGRTVTSFVEGLVSSSSSSSSSDSTTPSTATTMTVAAEVDDASFPSQLDKVIKFGKKSHATCACFSPDGQYLVTGSIDGFIEVWDYMVHAKLNTRLQYQAEDRIMMHDTAVLSISFNKGSDLLVSASEDATIKVWSIKTGNCVRSIERAHAKAITTVCFSNDSTQVLSASQDGTIRIYGLQSGRVLKTFTGHQSFVNSAVFTPDMTRVISTSSDATVRIWDVRTMECQLTFHPDANKASKSVQHAPIHGASVLSIGDLLEIVTCSASPVIHVNDIGGHLLRRITNDDSVTNRPDFAHCALSISGNHVYGVGEDHVLYVFNMHTTKLHHTLQLHKKTVLGIVHHPLQNLLMTWSTDGTLKLWR